LLILPISFQKSATAKQPALPFLSTSNATTNSSNAQLLNSLLKTLNVDSKTNGFVKMDLLCHCKTACFAFLEFRIGVLSLKD
jgi:hypothetical protein